MTRKVANKQRHTQGFPRPVSSVFSDFTPCTHAQSNILYTKYADKTDYQGLGIRVQVNGSGQGWVQGKKKKIIEVND